MYVCSSDISFAQGGHGLSRGARTNAAGHGNSATDRAWHVHVHATQGSRASHSIFSLCTYVLAGTFSGILLIATTFHPRGKMTYARCLVDIYFAHAYRQYIVNSFASPRANSTYTQYTHTHPLYTTHTHTYIYNSATQSPSSPYHCPKTTHIHTHIFYTRMYVCRAFNHSLAKHNPTGIFSKFETASFHRPEWVFFALSTSTHEPARG